MEWRESFELDVFQMDETHREFVRMVTKLSESDEASRLESLDAFIAHTEEHFNQENRWMEVVNFPGCHRAEHDRVITVMHEVRARLVAGEPFFLGQLVKELPNWFENHAATMDAALAFTLKEVGFDFERGCMPEGYKHAERVSNACSQVDHSN